MPLKVQVTLCCAECTRKVPLKGKTFTEHSRRHGSYSGVYLLDVYIVGEPKSYNDYNEMTITRGFRYCGGDDFPSDDAGLVCSLDCAVKRMTKVVRKLRPEKIEKEDEN
jgi:hypothetical protein